MEDSNSLIQMQEVVVLVAKVSAFNVQSTFSGWPSNAKSKEEF